MLTECALGDSQDSARQVSVECLASMASKVRVASCISKRAVLTVHKWSVDLRKILAEAA